MSQPEFQSKWRQTLDQLAINFANPSNKEELKKIAELVVGKGPGYNFVLQTLLNDLGDNTLPGAASAEVGQSRASVAITALSHIIQHQSKEEQEAIIQKLAPYIDGKHGGVASDNARRMMDMLRAQGIIGDLNRNDSFHMEQILCEDPIAQNYLLFLDGAVTHIEQLYNQEQREPAKQELRQFLLAIGHNFLSFFGPQGLEPSPDAGNVLIDSLKKLLNRSPQDFIEMALDCAAASNQEAKDLKAESLTASYLYLGTHFPLACNTNPTKYLMEILASEGTKLLPEVLRCLALIPKESTKPIIDRCFTIEPEMTDAFGRMAYFLGRLVPALGEESISLYLARCKEKLSMPQTISAAIILHSACGAVIHNNTPVCFLADTEKQKVTAILRGPKLPEVIAKFRNDYLPPEICRLLDEACEQLRNG